MKLKVLSFHFISRTLWGIKGRSTDLSNQTLSYDTYIRSDDLPPNYTYTRTHSHSLNYTSENVKLGQNIASNVSSSQEKIFCFACFLQNLSSLFVDLFSSYIKTLIIVTEIKYCSPIFSTFISCVKAGNCSCFLKEMTR